jgi:two-component system cell cycle sensor histidine kinase PleC
MNRAPTSSADLPASGAPQTALSAVQNPAWVVDVADGCILAANKAGALRLGLGRDSTVALDETMPALARLREIQRETARVPEVRERLTLWMRDGLEEVACLIRRPDDGPLTCLLIEVVDTGPPAPRASTPQDDARTLARIASAIRAGCAERREMAATNEAAPPVAKHAAPALPAQPQPQRQPQSAPFTTPAPGQQAAELARLAHELKTPLSAIVAAAEIMKDERFGPIANERYGGYVTDIHASARHALAVINSMLGKRENVPESATPDLIFTDIDLAALVDSTVSAMRPIAEQAGLALAYDGEAHLPHIIADATAVKQILLNLLTNAVKFTQAGGRITVRTRHAPDGSLHLSVHDTGSGISDEEIARVHAATGQPMPRNQTAATGGLGLGLPLVKMLAAANGAKLQIRRAPEGGTAILIAFAKSRVVPV